jgi:hypothetical protein
MGDLPIPRIITQIEQKPNGPSRPTWGITSNYGYMAESVLRITQYELFIPRWHDDVA